MATLDGELWMYNLAKVVVIDATLDYQVPGPSMPSDFYPVLEERWLPAWEMAGNLAERTWAGGYLYDWHEQPSDSRLHWTIAVVNVSALDS